MQKLVNDILIWLMATVTLVVVSGCSDDSSDDYYIQSITKEYSYSLNLRFDNTSVEGGNALDILKLNDDGTISDGVLGLEAQMEDGSWISYDGTQTKLICADQNGQRCIPHSWGSVRFMKEQSIKLRCHTLFGDSDLHEVKTFWEKKEKTKDGNKCTKVVIDGVVYTPELRELQFAPYNEPASMYYEVVVDVKPVH